MVSVGAGRRSEDGERIPMDVEAGDKILFGKWSGSEIKLDGEDLMNMKESHILGVIALVHNPSLHPQSKEPKKCPLKKFGLVPTPATAC